MANRARLATARSSAVNGAFFLASILPDFTGISHALRSCFLRPFVHLVLILKEPVGAKNVAARKGDR